MGVTMAKLQSKWLLWTLCVLASSCTTVIRHALEELNESATSLKDQTCKINTASWNIVDSYRAPLDNTSLIKKIARRNSDGALFASVNIGNNRPKADANYWMIYISKDNGVSWTEIDRYEITTAQYANVVKIEINSLGEVFVAASFTWGYNLAAKGLIRKGTEDINGNWTWTDIFEYQPNPSFQYSFSSMLIDSSDRILLTGTRRNPISGAMGAFFMHSNDNGTSWSTPFLYYHNPSQSNTWNDFNDIAVDPITSDIYLSGYGYWGNYYWLTMKSVDGGDTFTNFDTYANPGPCSEIWCAAYGHSIAINSLGEIATSGRYMGTNNSPYALKVRQYIPGTGWSIIKTLDSSDPYNNSFTRYDSNNNLYITLPYRDYGDYFTSQKTQYSYLKHDTGIWTHTGEYNGPAYDLIINGNDALISGYQEKSQGRAASILSVKGSTSTVSELNSFIVPKEHTNSEATSIAFTGTSKNEKIIVTGFETNASGVHTWITRISTDKGISWTMTKPTFGTNSVPLDSIALTNGHVLVTGMSTKSSGSTNWIIYDYNPDSNEWNKVFDVTGFGAPTGAGISALPYASGFSITQDSFGNIFALGKIIEDDNHCSASTNGCTGYTIHKELWTVYKSSNNGASWTKVDSYQEPSSTALQEAYLYPKKIYSDKTNNRIFAIGAVYDENWLVYSVVRMSTDQGSTWNTIYFNTLPELYELADMNIITDSNGNIYLSRGIYDQDWNYLLTETLKGTTTDFGTTWNWSSIELLNINNKQTTASSFIFDQAGTLHSLWIIAESTKIRSIKAGETSWTESYNHGLSAISEQYANYRKLKFSPSGDAYVIGSEYIAGDVNYNQWVVQAAKGVTCTE